MEGFIKNYILNHFLDMVSFNEYVIWSYPH